MNLGKKMPSLAVLGGSLLSLFGVTWGILRHTMGNIDYRPQTPKTPNRYLGHHHSPASKADSGAFIKNSG